LPPLSTWAQLSLPSARSRFREEFIFFHDFANIILTLIVVFVFAFITKIFINSFTNLNIIQGHALELVWTIIPGIILIQLALPSLLILYYLEETEEKYNITLKTIGHQWYWSYEFPQCAFPPLIDTTFDSYILKRSSEPSDTFRLLETDNVVNLPFLLRTRILLSRADVLHAWTIPALGVKADAIPGRINQIYINSFTPGVFFGQCSEICGANHRFIPIILQFLNFKDWIKIF
jgi:cytochrome c oxidase subunit 2